MIQKNTQEQFCTLDPVYPSEAYIVVLAISKAETNELRFLFPMPTIYSSIDEIAQSIEKTIDETSQNSLHEEGELMVLDTAIVLPINLHEYYPLKKEFWNNPARHFDTQDRIKLFNKVISNPRLNMLLVTPSYFSDREKKWYLSATLPLRLSYEDKEIENFMLSSDYPVDIRAKNAAIYSFGRPLRLKWATMELEEVENETEQSYLIN